MKNDMTRKEFLEKLPLVSVAFFGSWMLFQNCSKSTTDEDPCSDLSGLTEEEKQTRNQYEYVAKSPLPNQLCSNCALWIAPETGKTCGGCEIMRIYLP